jgi:hypothetical protein
MVRERDSRKEDRSTSGKVFTSLWAFLGREKGKGKATHDWQDRWRESGIRAKRTGVPEGKY